MDIEKRKKYKEELLKKLEHNREVLTRVLKESGKEYKEIQPVHKTNQKK